MNYIILAILFIFSGFFMKYGDDLYDINHNILFASLFGFLCGVLSAIATITDIGSAYIFIAILIGNLIAFKVDGIHHFISLVSFVVLCLIFGIPELNLAILFICIFSALFDEIGHEFFKNEDSFLTLFFEYRFFMKIVVFLLAIFGAFDVLIFILFILFELSYEFAGFIFKNNN